MLALSTSLDPATFVLFGRTSALIAAVCLLGAALLRWRPRLQTWAVIVPIVAFIAGEAFKAVNAAPPLSDRMIVTVGLMGCCANLSMPLRFRDAAASSALAFVAFATFVLGGIGHPSPNQMPTVAISGGVMLMSLGVAWRHEWHSRQAFLLALRARLSSDELARLSQTDPLTGLANRRVFDQTLSCSCQAASGAWVGLIMIDIDHFKSFNDEAGHAAGDRCLRVVAECLRANIREGIDVLARYGGEEFAVVLPNTLPADALAAAERLRAGVESLDLSHPVDGSVRISVGVVTMRLRQATCTPAALLNAADGALYRAKRLGRNRVVEADVPAPAMPPAPELTSTT